MNMKRGVAPMLAPLFVQKSKLSGLCMEIYAIKLCTTWIFEQISIETHIITPKNPIQLRFLHT